MHNLIVINNFSVTLTVNLLLTLLLCLFVTFSRREMEVVLLGQLIIWVPLTMKPKIL